jgi:putative membrane protein
MKTQQKFSAKVVLGIALFGWMASANSFAQTPTPPPLNDAQILGVVNATNNGLVVQANLVATRAVRDTLRTYAQKQIAEDSTSNNQIVSITQANNAPIQSTVYSTAFTVESKAAVLVLTPMSGNSFDSIYVNTQIKLQQEAIATLDKLLIPSATAANVKAFLIQNRAMVTAHLVEAQTILQAIRLTQY